jgi:hypothetical protein
MISTLLSYHAITRDIDKSLARVTSDRMTQREKTYYLAEIGKINSIDDFMSNQRVLSFAMRAFGLEDMLNSRALIRKVLEGGIDERRSLANTLADPRFREFAEAFNFKRYGEATTSFSRTQQGTVDRYMRQALETNAGRSNEGVRLALYFERKAPTINSVYSLLADRAIYKVIETALDLPSSLPSAGIEKQAALISQRLDIADLKDPKELGKFLRRFVTLWDIANGNTTASATGFVGVEPLTAGQTGISSDTLASIQALRLNRGR